MDDSMMRQVFDAFDSNQDGFLSPEEVMDFKVSRLGVKFSRKEMNNLLLLCNSHANPTLGLLFQDFLALYSNLDCVGEEKGEGGEGEEEEEEELHAAFSVLDKNGDGLISEPELRDFLIRSNLVVGGTLHDCQQMIKRVDKDGNGHIDFLELKHMMTSGTLI